MEKRTVQGMLPRIALGVLLLVIVWASGCDKRHREGSQGADVYFTVDTVRFDTVMHSTVSSMRKVSLRNDGRREVCVANVRMEGEGASAFHVVVDGVRYEKFGGATIPAGDSVILILTMYTEEYVPDAFEQLDARVVAEVGERAVALPIRGWNAGWSELEAVVAGNVVVPAGGIRYVPKGTEVQRGATLTLEAGSTLLFGNGAGLCVKGKLEAKGDAQARVCFLPQRMEPYYMRKPGQWAGVMVEAGSEGLGLSHVDVRGAVTGVDIKGKTLGGQAVQLENCRVLYSSQDGLRLAGGSEAKVVGSIFGQNYRHGISLEGAKAELIYCTVCAESMPPQSRLGAGIRLYDGEGSCSLDMLNGIVWGDWEEEVEVAGKRELGGRMSARGSVLRMSKAQLKNGTYFKKCTGDDPKLEMREQGLYHLGEKSSARRWGVPLSEYATDLFGTPRAVDAPDAGAVSAVKP